MRLLADSNIAKVTVLALRAAGHDVVWSGSREVDPGDEALLAEAFGNGVFSLPGITTSARWFSVTTPTTPVCCSSTSSMNRPRKPLSFCI